MRIVQLIFALLTLAALGAIFGNALAHPAGTHVALAGVDNLLTHTYQAAGGGYSGGQPARAPAKSRGKGN